MRGFVIVTVPAPVCSLDRFLAIDLPGPRLLWEPPDGPFGCAGRGVAHQIEARGDERWTALREKGDRFFASIVEQRAEGSGQAPPPRLFGGLAFHPMERWPAPWTPFGDASFTAPRWLYLMGRDEAFLRYTGPAGAPVPRRALDAILRALTSSGGVPPVGWGAPPRAIDPMGPDDWAALVGDALARISTHEFDKLVAARQSRLEATCPFDVAQVLQRLPARGEGIRFAFHRAAATFLGITPERLVTVDGRAVTTEAIAGSAVGPDATTRLQHPKERREHALVVDGICRALAPLCRRVDHPATPAVRALPGIQHLSTPIVAELHQPMHLLEVAQRLHPTPAVSGTPERQAITWIASHEPQPRGWYAGPVGWFDAEGRGELAVAIRSGVVEAARAWIYSGAGIVAESDPEAEYRETSAKQAPLLHALGCWCQTRTEPGGRGGPGC